MVSLVIIRGIVRKNDDKRPPEEDPTSKGSLRGMHLIDKASVYVKMAVGGSEIPCLMDTGCEITMVPRRLAQRHRLHVTPTAVSYTHLTLPTNREV